MPSDIENYLSQIRTAVYGRDVRDAIVNSIEQCYTDTSTGVTAATEAAETAADHTTAAINHMQTMYNALEDGMDTLMDQAESAISDANAAATAAQTAGTALSNNAQDIVLVQQNQPTNKPYNKVWVKPQVTEVEVPTYEEFSDLKSAVTPVGTIEYTTVDGYVNAQGGISPDGTAANGTKSTNRISCLPGDVFRFSISFSETKNEWIAYAFYSNIGAFISRTVPYNMVDGTKFEFTVTIPDNAYYILFSYRTFTTSSAIIDRYTPILGRIETAESTIEEIEIAQTTKAFIESHTPYTSKSTLQKDGGIYTNQGYGANLAVSDYLLVSALNGYTIKNALSWTAANGYSVAFYTADKTAIGNASAASSSDKTNYSADISTLAESYTGAVYMRVAFDTNDAFEIEPNHVSSDVYPPYNVNAYPHMVCCGDSVTAGFVVEGTALNPQTIYEVMDDYSYPAVLGRTYGVTVDKYAQSGISVNGFYTTIYPNIDFTDYDLAIFELGLNPGSEGYLNISDWDDAGTSTYIYRQMIAAVRAQNADIKIVLMRSQIYQNDALAVLQAIANESNCFVVDLMNTKYINLNDTKYHGYYSNSGTAALDPTHFNRIGYTAKAYDVVRWLGELLQ